MQEINMLPMLFGEAQVRIMRAEDGTPLIPLVDVAEAIGYNPRWLRDIITRNPKLFEGYLGRVTRPKSTGGRPAIQGFTKEGIIAILLKVAPSRVKDSQKCDLILKFQRWAIETLTAVIDGRLVLSPSKYVGGGKPLVKDVDAIRKLAITRRFAKRFPHELDALAESEGKCVGTIENYIKRYREADGIALHRQPRNDRNKPRKPEEAKKVLQYVKEHPAADGGEIWRNSGTGYSHSQVNRILVKLRSGRLSLEGVIAT